MAETPIGYLPDYFATPMPADYEDHSTEIIMAASGAEQRRPNYGVAGYRRFVAASAPLVQADRFWLRKFLHDHRGRYRSFYVWPSFTEIKEDFACGTVTAVSKIIAPIRTTGPIGGGVPLGASVGSITDVRVAGITKAFTRRALLPRSGTYAALRFDGTTPYVDCGASSTLRGVGDMSLGGWVYGFDFSSPRTIMANRVLVASGIILYVASGGALTFSTNFASSFSLVSSSYTIPADAWTHVFVTRTSGGPAIFYKNGVAFNTSASLTNPATATVSLKIGGEGGGGNPWNGMLNDLRIYDSALSAAEVLNIYNGAASPSANLRGLWRLTEGTGTSAADLSGTGNAGTLTNSPLWVSGEEEITFSAGAQTGAATAWGTFRERMIMRYDSDSIAEAFANLSGVYAVVSLPLKEVA